MEIKKTMTDALNKQINAELYSSYLYLSMSAYFEDKNLSGFAHWMRKQAKEEVEHAMKIFKYLAEKGARVDLDKIDKPAVEWKSPLDAFQAAYAHEQKVTAMINDLVELAQKENEEATESMLQWFVDEQVEEEDSANQIVQKLKLVGDKEDELLILDKELGTRGKG